MGQSNTWLIVINIMIHLVLNYMESKQYEHYSCPHYCGVDHEHIGIDDEFSDGLLGTIDSLCIARNDTNTYEGGYRCFEGQSEDSVRIME